MSNTNGGTIPLALVRPGERVRLVDILAGHKLRHRLTEMGLIPNAEVEIIQDEGGPLLLAINDTRLAVGRGVAHKITVQVSG